MNTKDFFSFTCAFAELLLVAMLSGCSWLSAGLPSDGPSRVEIGRSAGASVKPIQVIDINESTVARINASSLPPTLSEVFPKVATTGNVLGPGDAVEVDIWEAPPALLFGASVSTVVNSINYSATVIPSQQVTSEGTIFVPFAGVVTVLGKTPATVASDIMRKLEQKANHPQVIVRTIANASAAATIVGQVNQNMLLPLTAKGETVLDAVAAAGGTTGPVMQMSVQLTRDGRTADVPLDHIIRDHRENIRLAPGDVITFLHQPWSFTALGATGNSSEVFFERHGITLSQALGRIGGLQDMRADPKGVYLFRFEDSQVTGPNGSTTREDETTRVPIIYRINLKDPATFLLATQFTVRDKDVLYIANAFDAELQKFLSILTSSIYSVNSVIALH